MTIDFWLGAAFGAVVGVVGFYAWATRGAP